MQSLQGSIVCSCGNQGRCEVCRRIEDIGTTVKEGLSQFRKGEFGGAAKHTSESLLDDYTFITRLHVASRAKKKEYNTLLKGLEITHSARYLIVGTICGACANEIGEVGWCFPCARQVMDLVNSRDLCASEVISLQQGMNKAALPLSMRYIIKSVSGCALSMIQSQSHRG